MRSRARGFLLALAASAGGAALTGALAGAVVSLHPPGSGGASPAVWGLVVLPVAAALAAAAALARTAGEVFLNAAAFLLPQSAALAGVFFLFAHPGGGGGGLLLTTGEFWLELAAAYAFVVVLVGAASAIFRRVPR